MKLGFIGLGKMGKNMVLHLVEQGVDVAAYNRTRQATEELKIPARPAGGENLKLKIREKKKGELVAAYTLKELIDILPSPRVVWLMVAAGQPVDDVLDQLISSGIEKGDIVIDGGNSFYKDTVRRYDKLSKKGINYIDCGTSGGLEGARNGACLMIGGDEKVVKTLRWLWDAASGPDVFALRSQSSDLSVGGTAEVAPSKTGSDVFALRSRKNFDPSSVSFSTDHNQSTHEKMNPDKIFSLLAQQNNSHSWTYFGPSGAGHFVKMVHNGVEYGIDQAIGEGFAILEKGPYHLNLQKIAVNWNSGSVVRGWLIELLARALVKDPHLDSFLGNVGGGETGTWTVSTAKELGVKAVVLEKALEERKKSLTAPTFATKVVSALRHEYGGHSEAGKKE